ncbi:hypothetical protein [Sinorhizobium sp. BG8]|uniref:hypothetical protein n=1 Tax=Sinorhizobium sp. BG8 TaxID=2613773 RepID=UPI00193E7E49|nr:hypothetical protein [Sinorhizobium sp. BG8]QRM55732.1 hypothetical protein F3Y30_15255 [Sinorhizobium sp. BG8]
MEPHAPDPALFGHIRVVIGMVISLSMARLLTGLATFVQHPGKDRPYWIHLAWVLSMFLFILHFWWWEYRLPTLTVIGFGVYLFLICYCCLFFFLCVLLFPASIEEYGSYEQYFMSRRKWFFLLLALTYAVDLLDTALKGTAYFGSFGYEYPARNLAYIVLACIAAWTANRRFHAAFVTLGLIHQVSWIFRAFDILD